MDSNKILGKNMKILRKKKGYSQEKLAKKVGLHRTYIGGIEQNTRNVSLKNVDKISKQLGVTTSDLLTHNKFSIDK